MRKTLTLVLVFALLASVALVSTACTPKAPSKDVVIQFWDQEDAAGQKIFDELIAEFTAANPKITIERTHFETEDLRKNYTAASIGDTGPDVVFGPNDNLGIFVPAGLIVPITDILPKADIDALVKSSVTSSSYDGKVYMLPDRIGNELCLLYNKALVPTAPKTFEELITMSKELKTAGKVEYGLAYNMVESFWVVPFFGAFGASVFDDATSSKAKPTLNTDGVKKTFEFLKKLIDDGVTPKTADYGSAEGLFKEGKVAFLINGPWSFTGYKDAGMDFGIMKIPSIGGKDVTAWNAVKGYTVSANVPDDADRKIAVRLFLEYMTSKAAQVRLVAAHSQLPTNLEAQKDAAVTANTFVSSQTEALAVSVPMPIITQMRGVWDSIKAVQADVFSGKTAPADAPAIIQQKTEEAIAALGLT